MTEQPLTWEVVGAALFAMWPILAVIAVAVLMAAWQGVRR